MSPRVVVSRWWWMWAARRAGLVLLLMLSAPLSPASAAGAPETPVTEAASDIGGTTAMLHGTLNPHSLAEAGWYFAYSPEGNCQSAFATSPEPDALVEALPVSAELHFLVPNTTYGYCLVAIDGVGETVGPELAFTTGGVAPAVEAERSLAITARSAELEARINPENAETGYEFEYATDGALTEAIVVPGGTLPPSFGEQAAGPVDLAGALRPGTTYFWRVVAENAAGHTPGEVQSFTTVGFPVVQTGEATNVKGHSAELSGSVDPEGASATYRFEYIDHAGFEAALAEGATNPYARGAATEAVSLSARRGAVAVGPIGAPELQPGTTYHYAIAAENAAGERVGADRTFTTSPASPAIVSVGGASEITSTEATIEAVVDPRGLATTYAIELAPLAGGQSPVVFLPAPADLGAKAVFFRFEFLAPGTAYRYRVCALNQDGLSCGEDQSFTTLEAAVALTVPAVVPLLHVLPSSPGANPATGTASGHRTDAGKSRHRRCHPHRRRRRANCARRTRVARAHGAAVSGTIAPTPARGRRILK